MRLDDTRTRPGARRNRAGKGERHEDRGVGRRAIAGPVVVVACALVAVLVAVDYWSNAGNVYRGVEAGGVALGGSTPDEAAKLLEGRAFGGLREIRFTGPGGDFVLPAEEVGIDFDVGATVEEAYAMGRRGNVFERLHDRLRTAFGTVGLSPEIDYETGVAQAAVEDAARQVNADPRDASATVVGGEIEVEEARNGYALDVPATLRNVDRALGNLGGEVAMVGEELEPGVSTRDAEAAAEKARAATSGPLVLTAQGREWTLGPAEVGRVLEFVPEGGELRVGLDAEALKAGLADMHGALTVETVEAGFEVDGDEIVVTEGRGGRKVEDEKLLEAIRAGLFEGKREYEVPVATTGPKLTTAEAERLKPTELLGSYRTDYAMVPDDDGARAENLRMSSDAITGTVLAPGEVFSMNEKVSSLDYKAAKVIVNGQETKADGGGLCQVTSTLYNAVNYAGLDVVERYPHYAQLPYIRPGLDATVWFGDANGSGALDMKFENTTDGYVFLREYVADDGYIYAEVWGRPNGVEAKTWSEPVYRNADSAEWVTYQKVKEDGEVVYDGVLHKDTYNALEDEKGKPIPADQVPIAPVNP